MASLDEVSSGTPVPSCYFVVVSVSTAKALFTNEVLNWITTYSPSGTPAKVWVYVGEATFLDCTDPSGTLTDSMALTRSDWQF